MESSDEEEENKNILTVSLLSLNETETRRTSVTIQGKKETGKESKEKKVTRREEEERNGNEDDKKLSKLNQVFMSPPLPLSPSLSLSTISPLAHSPSSSSFSSHSSPPRSVYLHHHHPQVTSEIIITEAKKERRGTGEGMKGEEKSLLSASANEGERKEQEEEKEKEKAKEKENDKSSGGKIVTLNDEGMELSCCTNVVTGSSCCCTETSMGTKFTFIPVLSAKVVIIEAEEEEGEKMGENEEKKRVIEEKDEEEKKEEKYERRRKGEKSISQSPLSPSNISFPLPCLSSSSTSPSLPSLSSFQSPSFSPPSAQNHSSLNYCYLPNQTYKQCSTFVNLSKPEERKCSEMGECSEMGKNSQHLFKPPIGSIFLPFNQKAISETENNSNKYGIKNNWSEIKTGNEGEDSKKKITKEEEEEEEREKETICSRLISSDLNKSKASSYENNSSSFAFISKESTNGRERTREKERKESGVKERQESRVKERKESRETKSQDGLQRRGMNDEEISPSSSSFSFLKRMQSNGMKGEEEKRKEENDQKVKNDQKKEEDKLSRKMSEKKESKVLMRCSNKAESELKDAVRARNLKNWSMGKKFYKFSKEKKAAKTLGKKWLKFFHF